MLMKNKTLEILDNFIKSISKEQLEKFISNFGGEEVKEEHPQYQKALESVSTLPKYYIGQQIVTKYGIGIITKIEIPTSGLFVYPENTEISVWYGPGPIVRSTFLLKDLE